MCVRVCVCVCVCVQGEGHKVVLPAGFGMLTCMHIVYIWLRPVERTYSPTLDSSNVTYQELQFLEEAVCHGECAFVQLVQS